MATLALKSGLYCLRFFFNFLLLHILFILGAELYLNNLSSFWGPPQSTTFAMIGLYLTFEKGYTGKQVQRTHIFLAKKNKEWPRFDRLKEKNALTVLDVLQSPESEYMNMIRKWGKSVWEMWKPEHESVRKLVETYL